MESLQKSLHRFKPAFTITKLHLKLILSNILFLQISTKHIFLYDHDTSGHNLSELSSGVEIKQRQHTRKQRAGRANASYGLFFPMQIQWKVIPLGFVLNKMYVLASFADSMDCEWVAPLREVT